MKIKLLKTKLLNGKMFLPGAILDLEQATAESDIAEGIAEPAAPGVKPRKQGYNTTACA